MSTAYKIQFQFIHMYFYKYISRQFKITSVLLLLYTDTTSTRVYAYDIIYKVYK